MTPSAVAPCPAPGPARVRAKPRLGFFSFASCEGCQLAVLECERELPDLLARVEIARFREAASFVGEEADVDLDVAFVEGSITREKDAEEVRRIRRRSKILVALGACAATGGVNGLKNLRTLADIRREVYGAQAEWYETFATRPVSSVVRVDHVLRGCPIDRMEFLRLVTFLLRDLPLPVPKHPVCAECKAGGTVCLLLRGKICLGPATTCGCGAVCTRFGHPCMGCRGMLGGANLAGMKIACERIGLAREAVEESVTLFQAAGRAAAGR